MPSPTTRPHRAEASSPAGARDPLIDGLRSVALGRVVLWHAFAAPWLSWIFPAMPVMFFLAGSVLAGSVTRSVAGSVLAGSVVAGTADHVRRLVRRTGRILIPFWAYSVVVLTTLLLADGIGGGAAGDDADRWRLALSLAVPLHDLSGTDRDWLTGHLWYLTDYLVLLVLLPIVMLLARSVVTVVAAALLGLMVLEVGPLFGLPTLVGGVRIGIADLLCYGMFAVLGIGWALRRPAPPTTRQALRRASAGAALIIATLVAGQFAPLPRGSLNDSYLLLAVAALGWLLLIGAAEQPLRRLASVHWLRETTRAVSARALTIYLWHPAAILLALGLAPDGPLAAPAVLGLTVMFTAAAVLAVGWVEDVAARRAPRWWPCRRARVSRLRIPLAHRIVAAAALAALAAVGLAGTFADRSGTEAVAIASIPRPSDRTALADTAFAAAARASTPIVGALDAVDEPAELPAVELQTALERWITTQPDVDDAVASVASGSRTWSGSGVRPNGEPPAAESSTGMASLTKTFTAALSVQFAADGLLDLDAPVHDLPGVAPLPDGTVITARQLLQHSTGLIQYTDAPGYDPARAYTAAELISLSTQAPLAHRPDTSVTYSNSNYLWLGLLLESISDDDYAGLLTGRITGPLGLSTVEVISEPRAGWVGSASGGVTATAADVARFFDALLNRGEVLTTVGLQRMTDLNHLNGGLGVWPLCPCGENPDGVKWATGLGHYIGDGAAFAFTGDQLAVYVRIVGTDISAERMTELRDQLLVLIRDTAKRIDVEH